MESKDQHIIEKDELTGDKLLSGHEYDDIRELDNNLPKWWTWLFIITIVFSVIYVTQYDLLRAWPYQQEEWEAEMAAAGPSAAGASLTFDSTLTALTEPAALEAGKALWDKHCKVCHLEGQGLVGPNLTDNFSIHGCSFPDIVKIVVVGAPEKGMISWKGQLSDEDIRKVSSYTLSLAGKTFPNPKEPQGEPCK